MIKLETFYNILNLNCLYLLLILTFSLIYIYFFQKQLFINLISFFNLKLKRNKNIYKLTEDVKEQIKHINLNNKISFYENDVLLVLNRLQKIKHKLEILNEFILNGNFKFNGKNRFNNEHSKKTNLLKQNRQFTELHNFLSFFYNFEDCNLQKAKLNVKTIYLETFNLDVKNKIAEVVQLFVKRKLELIEFYFKFLDKFYYVNLRNKNFSKKQIILLRSYCFKWLYYNRIAILNYLDDLKAIEKILKLVFQNRIIKISEVLNRMSEFKINHLNSTKFFWKLSRLKNEFFV